MNAVPRPPVPTDYAPKRYERSAASRESLLVRIVVWLVAVFLAELAVLGAIERVAKFDGPAVTEARRHGGP